MINNKKVIVSITSYPPRIFKIEKTLKCIFSQSVLPDKVVLYLVKSDFENIELPKFLVKYYKKGLEIHWCEKNYKVHTKYFFAFQEYPNDLVITFDDDMVYASTAIEELIQGYRNYPEYIIARRAHYILLDDNNIIKPYNEWIWMGYGMEDVISHSLLATGVGGVLYQPCLLDKSVISSDEFLKISPTSDDIWLKYVEIVSNMKVVLIQSSVLKDKVDIEEHKNGLQAINIGENMNDVQVKNVFYSPHAFSACQENVLALLINEKKTFFETLINNLNAHIEKWLSIILKNSGDDVYIYGAGVIANRLKRIIASCNVPVKIKGFLVTSVKNNPSEIDGIKVYALDDFIEMKIPVIIGVSVSKQEEMFTLISRKFGQVKVYKLDTDILNTINLLDRIITK